ncbi:ATP-binding protein [Effusibacillus consociatus]|uniref:ATP-binding protein n=1 Tax=Effusibacillus consociatus TaxID=1117041 RepID=A0ABV9PZE5_9BACL
MKFPVRYWEENVLFDLKQTPWAAYRIPLKPYAYQSLEKKRAAIGAFAQFFTAYRGEGHLLSVTRTMDASEWKQKQRGKGCEYTRYAEAVTDRFHERRPWRRTLYLMLHLSLLRRGLPEVDLSGWARTGATFKQWMSHTGKIVEDQFWLRPRGEIDVRQMEDALAAEQLQFGQIAELLQGERCRPQEIEWLIRRGFFRGTVQEPPPIIGEQPIGRIVIRGDRVLVRPKTSLLTSLQGELFAEEKMKTWIVRHDDEGRVESYQAFFHVVDVPEEVPVAGSEWLYLLEDLPFPTEVSLRFRVESPHEAAQGLQRNRKALRDQRREYREAAEEAPISLEWAGKRGRVLENKLQKGMPLIHVDAWINVAGSNREEVEARATTLSQLYSNRQIRVVRAPGDQAKGFLQFVPGIAMLKDTIPMDPNYLAAAMLHGSREIGDPLGDYIGRTRQGIPVLLDLRRPMSQELNRSGAIVIVGTLGSGKSVLKKTLYYQAFNQEAIVFAIDPKGEDHCFAQLPEFQREMAVLNFAPHSPTRLNPFRLSESEERCHSIALDFLSLLLEGTKNDERADVILEAVERVFSQPKRDMFQLIRILQELAEELPVEAMAAEARRCATRLQTYAKSPYGKFVFSKDGEGITDLTGVRFVVVSLSGLPLPKRVGTNLTFNERFGLGLMYLVASLGREFMFHSPTHVLKIFGIDEAWMLKAFPEGALLIDEIIRMGRSFDIVPMIVTQNPSDVSDEEIRNNLGSIFCFRTEDPRAVRDNLVLLGLDRDDEDMRQSFRDLRSGECYMRDIEGRIGWVRIEPLPSDLLELFNTSPSEGGTPRDIQT